MDQPDEPAEVINVITLAKDEHRYTLLFDDHPHSVELAMRQLVGWALDDELPFDWNDAAILSERIRRIINRE